MNEVFQLLLKPPVLLSVVDGNRRKQAQEAEEKVREREDEVLIEIEVQQLADSLVVPSALHQHQLPQVPEARQREVAGLYCLDALLAHYPDADVCLLAVRKMKGTVSMLTSLAPSPTASTILFLFLTRRTSLAFCLGLDLAHTTVSAPSNMSSSISRPFNMLSSFIFHLLRNTKSRHYHIILLSLETSSTMPILLLVFMDSCTRCFSLMTLSKNSSFLLSLNVNTFV